MFSFITSRYELNRGKDISSSLVHPGLGSCSEAAPRACTVAPAQTAVMAQHVIQSFAPKSKTFLVPFPHDMKTSEATTERLGGQCADSFQVRLLMLFHVVLDLEQGVCSTLRSTVYVHSVSSGFA